MSGYESECVTQPIRISKIRAQPIDNLRPTSLHYDNDISTLSCEIPPPDSSPPSPLFINFYLKNMLRNKKLSLTSETYKNYSGTTDVYKNYSGLTAQ